MKNLLGVIAVIGIGWWLLSSSGGSSSYDDYGYYDDYEESTMDTYDALYDYWDEIAEYLDGTYTVEACSDNSGNCYDLDVDIDSGDIETIYFPNGGYVGVYSADVDSDGEAKGYDDGDYDDYWRFQVDEDDIYDALQDWAYDNDIELE